MHKVFGRSKAKDMSHKVLHKSLSQAEKLRSVRLSENLALDDFEKVRTLGTPPVPSSLVLVCGGCPPKQSRFGGWGDELAGTGTFGRVYLVKYKETGKYYALKVLRKMDVVRLKQVEHIKNEKNILLELNHPFIVTLCASSSSSSLSLSLSRVLLIDLPLFSPG